MIISHMFWIGMEIFLQKMLNFYSHCRQEQGRGRKVAGWHENWVEEKR